MNIRDTFNAWSDVPPWLQSAVEAYDLARRSGCAEAAMSDRNKCSIAPMIAAAIHAVVPEAGMRGALRDIAAERQRQIEVEGWTPEHDDEHGDGAMAAAAASYAFNAYIETEPRYFAADPLGFWPWSRDWWKPTVPRRDLIKAGALVVAEIERLDRAGRRE